MIIPNLLYDKITLFTCPKCGKLFDKRLWAGDEIEIEIDINHYSPQQYNEIRLVGLCKTCTKEEEEESRVCRVKTKRR